MEAIYEWLLKLVENIKIIRSCFETFIDCIANKSPSRVAYWKFMSGYAIALGKKPGVCLVIVG